MSNCEKSRWNPRDVLVRVDNPMHEPVGLPTRDHPRVPARNLQNELRAPRVARFTVRAFSIVAPAHFRQPQYAARDPFAEHTERIEIRELLSAPKEVELRRRVERLERADAHEGRCQACEYACSLDALALDRQYRERN